MSEPEKTLPQDVIDAIERGNKWTAQHGWIPKHGMDDTDDATTETESGDERTVRPIAENETDRDTPVESKVESKDEP